MSQLTKNTADLDELIAKANALPEAGGVSEDLTAVLDAQEQLISEIEAELEGKAAGGGGGGASVETCTVQLISQNNTMAEIAYTTLENNEIVGKLQSIYNNTEIIVLKKSMISVVDVNRIFVMGMGYINSIEVTGGEKNSELKEAYDFTISYATVLMHSDGTITIS